MSRSPNAPWPSGEMSEEMWHNAREEKLQSNQVCPPSGDFSDSASDGSEMGFEDAPESLEEKEAREKEEDDIEEARLTQEKKRKMKARQEKERAVRQKQQEEQRQFAHEQCILDKKQARETNFIELISSIQFAREKVLRAKSQADYQDLSRSTFSDSDGGLYSRLERFRRTQKGELSEDELMQVATAVWEFISANSTAKTKDVDIILDVGSACFEELCSQRFEQDNNNQSNYYVYMFLHVHYDYLRHQRKQKELPMAAPPLVRTRMTSIFDVVIGRLRNIVHKINHQSNRNITDRQMLTKFLCHEMAYRVKQELRPIPNFQGALDSLITCQKVKNEFKPIEDNMPDLMHKLTAQYSAYSTIFNSKSDIGVFTFAKKKNSIKNRIKKLTLYLKQARKDKFNLDRAVRDSFRLLWSCRQDMVEHARDILTVDASLIEDNMKNLTLSYERLILTNVVDLNSIATKLNIYEFYMKQDLNEIENKKALVHKIQEAYSECMSKNIKEQVRKTLRMVNQNGFTQNGFTPWGVSQKKWKLPYSPHFIATKSVKDNDNEHDISDNNQEDDKSLREEKNETSQAEMKEGDTTTTTTTTKERTAQQEEQLNSCVVAGLTDQCFTTLFKAGTYFETTRKGCIPSLVRYDDVPKQLVPLDDVISHEASTVLLTWRELHVEEEEVEEVVEKNPIYEVYLTFAEKGENVRNTKSLSKNDKKNSKKKGNKNVNNTNNKKRNEQTSILNYITFKATCDKHGKTPKWSSKDNRLSHQLLTAQHSTVTTDPNFTPYLENTTNKYSNYSTQSDQAAFARTSRTDAERLTIVDNVTNSISNKIRKDVKRCVRRRKEIYRLAYNLIESIASNDYRYRPRNGSNSVHVVEKLQKKFKKSFNACRVEFNEYYTCTSLDLQRFYSTNECPSIQYTELFEMYTTLGKKLIVALAASPTNHVPLYSVLLKEKKHLYQLWSSLKDHINTLPTKAIYMNAKQIHGKSNNKKSLALFEAALELSADVKFENVINPKFEDMLLPQDELQDDVTNEPNVMNPKRVTMTKNQRLNMMYTKSTEKRIEMLRMMSRSTKYKSKVGALKKNIAFHIHDALQRNEIALVSYLSKLDGVKPHLEDLLHDKWPIDVQIEDDDELLKSNDGSGSGSGIAEWEEQIKYCLKYENMPWTYEGDKGENYFSYIETSVLWQLQLSKHPLLCKNSERAKIDLIKFALDIFDDIYDPESVIDESKKPKTVGHKMSSNLMSTDELVHPWFIRQGRLFCTDQEGQYHLRSQVVSVYSRTGLYNYLAQAMMDNSIELVQLYLTKGASMSHRGCIDCRVFTEFLQHDYFKNEKIFGLHNGPFSMEQADELQEYLKQICSRKSEEGDQNNLDPSKITWYNIGETPLHMLLKKEDCEIKEELMNSVLSRSTGLEAWIKVDDFYDNVHSTAFDNGITISGYIESLNDEEKRASINKFISDVNATVAKRNTELRKTNKKTKTKVTKGKSKKKAPKKEVLQSKKQRDEEYELLLQTFMKFHGRVMYIEMETEEKLCDLTIRPGREAVRGQMKTRVRVAAPRHSGETKETTEEDDLMHTFDLHKNTKLRKLNHGSTKVYHDDNRNCLLKDIGDFDGATWEIHVLPDFNKFVRKSKTKKQNLINKIFDNLKLLGQGKWIEKSGDNATVGTIAKRLQHVPSGLRLYEMKVTKLCRVYWEITVALSPRLSKYTDDNGVEQTRPFYTEIIRVHSAGTNKNRQDSDIQKIINSFERKDQCQLRRELQKQMGSRGQNQEKDYHSKLKDMHTPTTYAIQQDTKLENNPGLVEEANDQETGRVIFTQGPSVSNKSKYNLQASYLLDSTFISALIYGNKPPECPFEVEESEMEIIAMRSPNCSMLLLGRSGTGKTTCLVYRMWNEYKLYWEMTGKALEDDSTRTEEHVHALFMTKSTGLRWEIRDHFRRIRQTYYDACKFKQKLQHEQESKLDNSATFEFNPPFPTDEHPDNPQYLPWSLNKQDFATNADGEKIIDPNHPGISETVWPLFLAQHEWLHILDHTLPCWKDEEEHKDNYALHRFSPFIDHHKEDAVDDSDDDEQSDNSKDRSSKDKKNEDRSGEWFWTLPKPKTKSSEDGGADEDEDEDKDKKINFNARIANKHDHIEITFVVFKDHFYEDYKTMEKRDTMSAFHLSAALVYSEIKSHIQGSVEALKTEVGYVPWESEGTPGHADYIKGYKDFEKKRCRLNEKERDSIYKYFESKYLTKRTNKHLTSDNEDAHFWDLGQATHNLWSRINNMTVEQIANLTPIQRIYVDEVQDYTQAELALIIRMSRDPNGLFLCGDTAQNIEKGVSFRFEELKTLFNNMRENQEQQIQERKRIMDKKRKKALQLKDFGEQSEAEEGRGGSLKKKKKEQQPKQQENIDQEGETKQRDGSIILSSKVSKDGIDDYAKLQDNGFLGWSLKNGQTIGTPTQANNTFRVLVNNFRSHAGVLDLAGVVVELLYKFFPQSLDQLPTDRGVNINGPKPLIFDASKAEELEVILSGGRVDGSHKKIEFGVSQAILTRKPVHKVKKDLPDGLQTHPNIFTIKGSKGLEFEDVLIFNFFSDSKVDAKTWRSLSQYNDDKAEPDVHANIPTTLEEYMNKLPKREKLNPTEFVESKHRELEHELKDLYIAVTRARTNVWFYDAIDNENQQKMNDIQRTTLYQLFKRRGLTKTYGKDQAEFSFSNSSTPDEWAKNAYQTKMRAKSSTAEGEDKAPMIQKLKRAASAYQKGGCPNDAFACNGFAAGKCIYVLMPVCVHT